MNPEQQIIMRCMGEATQGKDEDWIFMHIDQPQFWLVKMGKVGVLLPKTGDDSFYGNVDLFQRHEQFQFGNGYFWKPCRFGESRVGSVSMRDRRLFITQT